MTTTWAAKVLEGVPRLHPWHNEDAYIKEADALAAIARMGAGDGLVERAKTVQDDANEMIDFLSGQAELDGMAFGDPNEQGHRFWWRKHLSRFEAMDTTITDLLAHIAALTAERDDAVIKRAAWELSARQMEAERDALRDRVEKDAKAHEKEIAVWAENYAALERKVARLEGAGDFARLIGNDAGKDDKDTVLVSYGMLRRLRAALTDGGKHG